MGDSFSEDRVGTKQRFLQLKALHIWVNEKKYLLITFQTGHKLMII